MPKPTSVLQKVDNSNSHWFEHMGLLSEGLEYSEFSEAAKVIIVTTNLLCIINLGDKENELH